ncbi:hypothetical protein Hdeb2414_s0015g00448191 [Helianthus debilis subsp. tardiflorus]
MSRLHFQNYGTVGIGEPMGIRVLSGVRFLEVLAYLLPLCNEDTGPVTPALIFRGDYILIMPPRVRGRSGRVLTWFDYQTRFRGVTYQYLQPPQPQQQEPPQPPLQQPKQQEIFQRLHEVEQRVEEKDRSHNKFLKGLANYIKGKKKKDR